MARRPNNLPPPYPKKPHNGQARITVRTADERRKDLVLGPHGSSESLAEYRRVLAELTAHGGLYPVQVNAAAASDLTVNELLLQFWRWAEDHYRDPEGHPTRELDNLKDALRPLKEIYGSTLAKEFGPVALRAVQKEMVRAGLCRSVVNFRTNRIRRAFKWAASFELLPVAVHQALQTVPGLRRGHGKVREAEPIKPVSLEHVEATLPFMPGPVAAMVRLQLLTACRAGEVLVLRGIDLNTSGPVWTYQPYKHKNQHRGQQRLVFLGPKAQAVLKPFLKPDLHAHLFNPRDWVAELHARRAKARKTKRTPSELKRQRRRGKGLGHADRYNRRSYRQAVVRGCDRANALALKKLAEELTRAGKTPEEIGRELEGKRLVPRWSPLQLRHTAATAIRAKYGVEAAKVLLGHSRVETTQIYAERDLNRAAQIMVEVG